MRTYILYAFSLALASELVNTRIRAVVTPLNDIDIPNGSRVILPTNIALHLLIDGIEIGYVRVKNLVSKSSSFLFITYMSMEYAGLTSACGSVAKDFRPRNRVHGLALRKFGTRLRMPAVHVKDMCKHDRFEEAATVPNAFGIAVYVLIYLARFKECLFNRLMRPWAGSHLGCVKCWC